MALLNPNISAPSLKTKRDRMKIIADILEISKSGTTKTRVMYKANLSYDQLKRYLTLMLNCRLLVFTPGERLYRTTSKGMLFLSTFGEFWRMGESFNRQLSLLKDLSSSTTEARA